MVTPETTLVFGNKVGRFEIPDESFVDDFFKYLDHGVYKGYRSVIVYFKSVLIWFGNGDNRCIPPFIWEYSL